MSGLRFDIASLHAAYAAGLSPRETVETAFARLSAVDDPGIFIHVADEADVLAAAAALPSFDPKTFPLWGVPFAVKDNIDVAGMPTTAACREFAYTPTEDATVVALLKAAGALVIGKTNLDQFATGLVGVRTPYAIPRNAIDPTLVPGGSSSGSAVAVAHGIVSFALGTDTAGSGRVPAGLNNIVGLKPSVGALSAHGVVPACRTIDCVSVFALTVDDAYAAFSIAARFDPRDPWSKAIPVRPLAPRPPVLRVGVPAKSDRCFYGDAAMEGGYETALARLTALGCAIVELPFADFYATASLLYDGAFVAERYAGAQPFIEAHEEALHPITRAIMMGARKFSAADAFAGLYALQALRAKTRPLIASVDLICVPTAPTHVSLEAIAADPIGANSRLGTYTNFVNFLDLCGMAVPTGTLANGLPASATLLAPSGRDALIATLAREMHTASGCALGATGWPLVATLPSSPEDGGMIEIVVVGAHLSGMPLNHELQTLGAVFRRATHTTDGYRFYALAGQKPQKPGLIRDETGAGGIEVEVWALPPDGFGRFVAAIPPPLSIGSVALADGTQPKGFLVEPAGLVGAREITDLGGWRAFMREGAALAL